MDVQTFISSYSTAKDSYSLLAISIANSLLSSLASAVSLDESQGYLRCKLDDGRWLYCIVLESEKVEAGAKAIDEGYVVFLTSKILQIFFSLATTIWRDNNFIARVRQTIRSLSQVTTLPPGFEPFLFGRSAASYVLSSQPFFRSFVQCVSLFWLHEFAHVFRGHLGEGDDMFLEVAEPFEGEERECVYQIPYLVAEIDADNFALDCLFTSVHQRVLKSPSLELELVSTYAGCVLFPLAMHILNELLGRKDLAERHPPLFFRANSVRQSALQTFTRVWPRVYPGPFTHKYQATLQRYEAMFADTLLGITQQHPSFYPWASTSTNDMAIFANDFEAKAREGTDEWQKKCKASSCWPAG